MGELLDILNHARYRSSKPNSERIRINKKKPGSSGFLNTGPYGNKQPVVIRSSYRPATHLKAHINYLCRDGKGIDGTKPDLFSFSNGKILDVNEIKKMGILDKIKNEEIHTRFMISPLNGYQLNLEQFAIDVMKTAQRRVGYDITYIASIHYNTDRPHINIVAIGPFSDYFKTRELREICVTKATQVLGIRTQKELLNQKEKEITQDRFTTLDRVISKFSYMKDDNKSFKVELKQGKEFQFLNKRLKYLEGAGLAKETGDGKYDLDLDWRKILKDRGSQKDIQKKIYKELKSLRDQNKSFNPVIYKKDMKIRGTIVYKGIADELFDKPFAVIHTKAGKDYYVEAYGLESFRKKQHIYINKGKVYEAHQKSYPNKDKEKSIER